MALDLYNSSDAQLMDAAIIDHFNYWADNVMDPNGSNPSWKFFDLQDSGSEQPDAESCVYTDTEGNHCLIGEFALWAGYELPDPCDIDNAQTARIAFGFPHALDEVQMAADFGTLYRPGGGGKAISLPKPVKWRVVVDTARRVGVI